MIKGITEKEEIIIKNILKKYDFEFYCYGSRVKGNFTNASDLDMLVKSDTKIPSATIFALEEEFNRSMLPFIVNISDYNSIDKNFLELIKPDLVEI